jgi:hypothetical protein
MTIEAYVPVLLNFRENTQVYSSEDLSLLSARVLNPGNGISEGAGATEFKHALSESHLRTTLTDVKAAPDVAKLITRVEVYYYHHRIILKYVIAELAPSEERSVRQLILVHSRHVLISNFVNVINTAGPKAGPLPDESGRVTTYYSYCILLVPLHPDFVDNIENLLGSHTFRIVEVTPKLLERDRVHLVRISIPSTHLYSVGTVKTFLRVDIINAIYQHMLYAKKEQDAGNKDPLVAFSEADLDHRNVMQEAQLHALWDHAVDAWGGRMVDLQGVHQQTLLFRASILALLLALVGIIITVALTLY